MTKNKTQNGENGSRKPLNYKQVGANSELVGSIKSDYSELMKDGLGYRGKVSVVKEALSRKYNVSGNAVDYALKQSEQKENSYSRKVSNDEVLQIVDLYNDGKSVKEIAENLGRSKSSVYKAMNDYRSDHKRFRGEFAKMTPTPLQSNLYSESNAPVKQSWFGKYVAPLASAAVLLLAATGVGLGCGSSNPKNSNASKAPTSYSVKTEAKSEKAEGLEGAVKVALGEMKKEEQSPLEDEAEEPGMGGNGDGDDDLPGQYNIGADAYANAAGNAPEVQPISDRPMDKDDVSPKPQPQPEPKPTPQPEPEKQPEVKPTPQPAPAPREGLFGDKEQSTELAIEPYMSFGYTGTSGDVTGGEARAEFGAKAKSNSGTNYDFNFKYSNKDESWNSAQGDDVSRTTTGMTPTLRIDGKDSSYFFRLNHVESDETMKNSSRNVDTFGESGLIVTTTEGSQSEQRTSNSLDSFSFDSKVKKLRLFGDIASDKSKTSYDEDSYALVEFSDPTITPVLVNNKVGTTTNSTTNSYKLGAGWDFGNVEPGVIGRHNETKWKMNADLNGESILSESGSSSQNTLGVYSNFNFDKGMGRLTLLGNSGDDLKSSQKVEADAHWNQLLGDKYVIGAGLGRNDGETKGRAAFFWKTNDTKTGQDVLKDVEKYVRSAEDDALFPEPTTKDQKRQARLDRDMSAGADGIFFSFEGGQNGWRADAATPIPGTNGKGFVYGAYEDGTLEKRVEGGAGWKLGKHFTLRFGGYNSQDKESDKNSNGFDGTLGFEW